ncbi:MAG: Ig-like domain-containing protein [Aggregatilineales bacterium]
MKRWIKVLLLTLLAGVVIAGLGSVLPARAADGEEMSITSPADGSTVAGVTTIIASATDDGTVLRVEFFVNGTSIGADENGADGWSVDWDTTAFEDGVYTLTAYGKTKLEQVIESQAMQVTVQKQAVSAVPEELIPHTLTAYGKTKLEQVIESQAKQVTVQHPYHAQAVQVTVQNTETPPGDEPTPTVPDVLPAMLCDLDDGSLNSYHCGRPVAIFRVGSELHLYGIDINTGHGSLALLVTAADIESAGVPEDVPVLIAVGENPYTHRPIALYRLPGGEFQLNTAYWDGKEYIVKWQPGAAHVEVIYW